MTRKEAKEFIAAFSEIRDGAADELAVKVCKLYPEWKPDVEYKKGVRVRRGETLYKAIQTHFSQAIYPPDTVAALWAVINEKNTGALNDPIPAAAGMVYEKDLYYVYDDVIYLCVREDSEGGTVLQFTPDQLVGQYFEAVTA